MNALEIAVATSWVLIEVLNLCHCQDREPNSVENVILARRVINEVNMKDYNYTSDPKRNQTLEEIQKYLKENPSAKDLLDEDKKAYEAGEKEGEEESKKYEKLLSSGLIPYMFLRCNRSYTVNHLLMYNVSLQYSVGNNSLVPFETTGDRIRVAFMKFQDYINRMNQWTRKLIKGGGFTLKKVERDTFCNLVYRSNYTNSVNNTKLIMAFEDELQDHVSYCLQNVDKMFAGHYEKVQKALLADPVHPVYVPLGKDLQEKFIIECNLYNPIRHKLWNHLMSDPGNKIYRETFKDYNNISFTVESQNPQHQGTTLF